jgi:hypothetical protein
MVKLAIIKLNSTCPMIHSSIIIVDIYAWQYDIVQYSRTNTENFLPEFKAARIWTRCAKLNRAWVRRDYCFNGTFKATPTAEQLNNLLMRRQNLCVDIFVNFRWPFICNDQDCRKKFWAGEYMNVSRYITHNANQWTYLSGLLSIRTANSWNHIGFNTSISNTKQQI